MCRRWPGGGINVVLGTTGWQQHEAELRKAWPTPGRASSRRPNFSTGVVLFEAIVAQAAKLFAGQPEFGAWLHEAHHAAKKDAPSGTALKLKRAMEEAGYRSADRRRRVTGRVSFRARIRLVSTDRRNRLR